MEQVNIESKQVDIQLNSVNFICDWKYNISIDDDFCCFCKKKNYEKYQKSCSLKVYGIVAGKCGHLAHTLCYKTQVKQSSKCGSKLVCFKCPENCEFKFDKELEKPHTQKIYKT